MTDRPDTTITALLETLSAAVQLTNRLRSERDADRASIGTLQEIIQRQEATHEKVTDNLRKRNHEIAAERDQKYAAQESEIAHLRGRITAAQRWADEMLDFKTIEVGTAGAQRILPWWDLASEHDRNILLGLLTEINRLRYANEELRSAIGDITSRAAEVASEGT